MLDDRDKGKKREKRKEIVSRGRDGRLGKEKEEEDKGGKVEARGRLRWRQRRERLKARNLGGK